MPWLTTWDINARTAELLRPYELPYFNGTVSMAPGLETGVIGPHDPLSNGIYWLDSESTRPMNHNLARANRAVWSPDGKWIALFGNKKRTGFGPGWASDRFDLMLLPASCRDEGNCAEAIEVIEEDFTGAEAHTDYSTLAWSPDSEWLAFGGGLRRPGIWIKNIETGRLIRAVEPTNGNFYNPSWSPDGERLVFLGPPEGGWSEEPLNDASALYIADVSSLLHPAH